MGWFWRVKDYESQPKEQQCKQCGSVLVVWNKMRGPTPVPVVDIEEKHEQYREKLVADGYIKADEMYPPHCMFGTQWYQLFKSQHASAEHVRLCREHAKQEHWIW